MPYSTDIDKPLTEKMRRFCEEYIKCGIASDAYRKVFGANNEHTDCSKASKLLHNPRCQKYINELRELKSLNTIMDLQECLEIVADVARNDNTGNRERLKAVELMMKNLGAFVEKKEVKISDSIDLEVSLESKSEAE